MQIAVRCGATPRHSRLSPTADVMAESRELDSNDRLDVPAPQLEVPAVAEQLTGIRAALRNWLSGLDASDELLADVLLAVDEACTNCVEHAYPDGGSGTMSVTAQVDSNEVRVVVRDHGQWKHDADDDVRRGRGMPVMRALTTRFDVRYGSDGTHVTLVFPLRSA